MTHQEMRALNDERDAWIEAIPDQIKSEKRRNTCLNAVDRWYHQVLLHDNVPKERSNRQ
jgi:hypothetical protein